MNDYQQGLVQDLFLGRQSILDKNHNLVAFELLFRSSLDNWAEIANDVASSALVIHHAFAELGVSWVLGRYRGTINVSTELLMSDVVEILPKDRITLEIVGSVEVTQPLLERCADLRYRGFQLSLDDYTGPDPSRDALVDAVDVVKVDIARLDSSQLSKATDSLKRHNVQLLAERVEHRNQASQCADLGFDFLQGNYFAQPDIITGKRLTYSETSLMQLLGLVLSDVDTVEIVTALKQRPELALQFLKIVNRASVGVNTKISSIHHAVTVLGRVQIRRWLQMLLFSLGETPDAQFPSPLLVLAATRGRLMELIAEQLVNNDKSFQDRAFMTGILSLMTAQFGIDLAELIKDLPLEVDVKNALLDRAGRLGSILVLVEVLEQPNFRDALFAIKEMGSIDNNKLLSLQMDAMRWAAALGDPSE